MKGLPASGKSTHAEEILKQGNTVRLNKDLLRTMLHCDKFTGYNEGLTREAQRGLAFLFLNSGKNVIIDDTNLNSNTVQSWKDFAKEQGAKLETVDLGYVPVEECLARDRARAKRVGDHVIQKMALQYLGYMKSEKVVVCDLDGTLCDIEHRRHFVQQEPKDWKGFFGAIEHDAVRTEVSDRLFQLAGEHSAKVVLVSARPETCRVDTEAWLEWVWQKPYDLLIMREAGDRRPDTEVKSEIFVKYLKNLYIVRVLDDRPSVIRMWREKGLEVEDMGTGEEF